MKQTLLQIISILTAVKGNENFYLPEPITVRLSDNDYHIFEIHGMSVSPLHDLYVMDALGDWHLLDTTQTNAGKMLDAIEARLQKIFKLEEVA